MKVKGPEVTNGDSAGDGSAKKVKGAAAKRKNKKSPKTAATKKKKRAEKSAFEEEKEEVPLTRYEEESEDSDREQDVGGEDGKGGKKKVRYFPLNIIHMILENCTYSSSSYSTEFIHTVLQL